jgi:hypothetical protein
VLIVGDVYSSSLNVLSYFIAILFSIFDHLKEFKLQNLSSYTLCLAFKDLNIFLLIL